MTLSRADAERFKKNLKSNRPFVVVPGRDTFRIFDLVSYERLRETANRVKPWEKRKKSTAPDPLGAVQGTVLGSLSREEIYPSEPRRYPRLKKAAGRE